ncbi:hypothetical protein D5038_14670 [Verminephrobacter aporrectodeae subsp. tuberculatae]|uniref:hypothetical protein n=1 Tax=Verminephrobacter aporrectodeae TaxID=1110389 RepID=UPI002237B3F2|nr:hypothetical protein [Verminephrobacter aporrectodeae]MCW5257561.1 hypothetical protein [Verminephrobacter aporrectodeae subsp. tuberculatae]
MALDAEVLRNLTKGSAKDAWRILIDTAIGMASKPLAASNAPSEVVQRDREIGALDHFLSSVGWDLWQAFGDSVERTSDRLARWWAEPYNAKAVLILDGLSLRELPWLVQGARERGFTLHGVEANASELPATTHEFARALGLSDRSQLGGNRGGLTHRLQPAHTESVDIPWKDCENLLNGSPNWVFWHHWPDNKLHASDGAGQGLDVLIRDVAKQLGSDDFWAFVERLATGRRLVITSDHGYAATGHFHDAEGEVAQFLKKTFASGRSKAGPGDTGPFVPPVSLQMDNPRGTHLLALGRWKWRSQGGYPTLTHGGLSLLEVLSPFVEISNE